LQNDYELNTALAYLEPHCLASLKDKLNIASSEVVPTTDRHVQGQRVMRRSRKRQYLDSSPEFPLFKDEYSREGPSVLAWEGTNNAKVVISFS